MLMYYSYHIWYTVVSWDINFFQYIYIGYSLFSLLKKLPNQQYPVLLSPNKEISKIVCCTLAYEMENPALANRPMHGNIKKLFRGRQPVVWW